MAILVRAMKMVKFMMLLSVVLSFALADASPSSFGETYEFEETWKSGSGGNGCKFDAIYQFGDSISDTGNLIRETKAGVGPFSAIVSLPYGESYFNNPTGRCSDGLLMVDFLAKALNLPLLNPYLEKNAMFAHGVNFAVAGATALDFAFFAQRNLQLPVTNSTLSVQLDWFKSHLASLCHTDCKKKLEKSLFMVGTVGGNDYNYAFFQGKTMEEVRTYVPHVIRTIEDAVKKMIDLGAKQLVVPGNFPIGCAPIYLTAFGGENSTYDEYQCVKGLNEFARFHNHQLELALKKLRAKHPDISILYADYYKTYQTLLRYGNIFGFAKESSLQACCGTGGKYNFNPMTMCGGEGVLACANPNLFLSWDGVHLTQRAYALMARMLIGNLHSKMKC